jgi:MFS transporter, DHA2 family, multidrug resistance protein
MQRLIRRNAVKVATVRPDRAIAHFWNPLTAAGRTALDEVLTQQAQIIAYIDDYKLFLIATLAAIPLLVVFRRSAGNGAESDES